MLQEREALAGGGLGNVWLLTYGLLTMSMLRRILDWGNFYLSVVVCSGAVEELAYRSSLIPYIFLMPCGYL